MKVEGTVPRFDAYQFPAQRLGSALVNVRVTSPSPERFCQSLGSGFTNSSMDEARITICCMGHLKKARKFPNGVVSFFSPYNIEVSYSRSSRSSI